MYLHEDWLTKIKELLFDSPLVFCQKYQELNSREHNISLLN